MSLTHPNSWILLVVLTLALRGAALGALWADLDRDPDGYRQTARALVELGVYAPDEFASRGEGRPIPGAYRPPVYPLFLAGLGAVSPATSWRAGLAQWILGTATVGLTFALARRLGLGRWCWLAAGLVALDPLLLSLSAQIMTETLAAFLATATLLVVDRAGDKSEWERPPPNTCAKLCWPLAAGALAGLAALCRPAFLPWALGLPALGGLAASKGSGGSRAALTWGVVCLGGLSLALAPWGIRNWLALGAPLLTTTHGGYTFYLANNQELFDHQRGNSKVAWNASGFNDRWHAARLAALGHGPWPQGAELAADRLAYSQARQEIVTDPRGFVRAAGVRVSRLWAVLPERLEVDEPTRRRAARFAIATWYAGVLSLAALGLGLLVHAAWSSPGQNRASPRRYAPLVWLLVCFTLLHGLYWTNLRMRSPLMPAVAVLAAVGAAGAVRRK